MAKRKRSIHRRPVPTVISIPHLTTANKPVWVWTSVALVVLVLLLYAQTIQYEFVNFDDGVYVADNPAVQQGLTANNIGWASTTMTAGNWHPLTWISHMLDCQIFGLDPGWHHLVNTLLHSANSVLVFIALATMTGMVWRGALVAALFAIHPLHVESVAWIAERKDLLSTFFGLLAIWAYVRYTRARSAGNYGLVLCFFALSLLSKPMLVTLPFLFLLLDVWPLERLWNVRSASTRNTKVETVFLEKLPLLAMSAASSIITFKAQHSAGAVAPIDLLPLSQRLPNAITAYVAYLGKAFWPINLAVFYPRPTEISAAKTILAILLLVGITIGVSFLARKQRWLLVGWLWFLGTLVPVIGLVQVGDQAIADRYTYLPLIGLFIMIVWSIPIPRESDNRSQLITVAACLPLLALAGMTFRQVRVWENTETLFSHAIEVTQGNYLAHNLLAGAFGQKGDLVRTQEHVEKALQIKPNYAGAHYNLGKILLNKGDFAGAQKQYELALETNQLDPAIWNALGVAQANQGLTDKAISNYRHTLELNPNFADAYANLGSIFLSQGKNAEAIEASEKALRLKPVSAEAYDTLGTAFLNLRRADESIFHSRKAIELNPTSPRSHVNLGIAFLAKGNADDAISQFEFALRLDPTNEVAQKLLDGAKQKRNGLSLSPNGIPD